MERLKPILDQKFWILLFLVIVMTLVGWWLATGTLASTIADRTKAVNDAFSMIPSGEIPNTDWSTKLAARNAEQDRAIKYTRGLLWERQLSRMTWPDSVRQFAWQNGYRGEIPLAGRENYRIAYGFDVRHVWESVRPFNPLDGTGIVMFGRDERELMPQRSWGTLAPSSAEMWDAQEDQWLMESLLASIVSLNGGPDAQRTDAYLHVIERLELHGGQPAGQRKAAGGGQTGSAGNSGGAHAMMPSGFGEMGSGGGAGRGGMNAAASADFDWREELGDDGSSRGFGGGPGAGGSTMPMTGPGAAHSPGGGGTGAAANTVRRYVDDDAALPYKTRGFYMTVIMDHRKIPSLIAELTASERSAWPVEILRVQMVRLHDNDVDSRGGAGGMSGGSPGYPGPTAMTTRTNFPMPTSFNAESDVSSSSPSPMPTFNDPSGEPLSPTAAQQAAAAQAALDAALQDPFMARVALCGLITIYKEVKPEPVAAAAGQPAAAQPETPAQPDPANSAVPGATPAEGAAPAEGTPATPQTPDGESPNPATPQTPAAPQTPASPPAESPAAPADAGAKPTPETPAAPAAPSAPAANTPPAAAPGSGS